MSLYQKYRPKNFSDVVGQDFVKQLLANSCRTQTFHHGYIFFGFHGIGKTTLARIFSQAVNCTNITADGNPCHECANCQSYNTGRMIDVIEIDAASYTGVDNIREIIDHAKFTPTQGKYKVYIIDEVHMLSKGAFNALLKTLEEPPAHTIFLLATTEIHKVPDTILSRVIRFDLTKIGESDMQSNLEKICTEEGIKYDSQALNMIIHRSRGSLRDAQTMFEKCLFENTLKAEYVEKALHLVNQGFIRETVEACISGNADAIKNIHTTLKQTGSDVRQFASQVTEWIVDHLEESFETGQFREYREVFDLFTRVFIQSRQVAVPMDVLTMALYERIKTGSAEKTETKAPKETPKKVEPEAPKAVIAPVEIVQEKVVEKTEITETPKTESPTIPATATENTGEFTPELFLTKIAQMGIKATLLPLLRTAYIRLMGETIIIQTTTFAKGRCQEATTYAILTEAALAFGADIRIESIESVEPTPPDITDVAASVFG